MGWPISRSLLHAHGGQIAVTSEGVGKGATFTIELPLGSADLKLIPKPPPRPNSHNPLDLAGLGAQGTAIRVLLIEDHAATRSAMAKMLERRGYTVDQAGSVEASLGLARIRQFALVISDIGLPDGDGYGLMLELKKLQPAVKTIALSGYGMEQDHTRAANAGFSELLVKPVTIQNLEAAISRVLGSSG